MRPMDKADMLYVTGLFVVIRKNLNTIAVQSMDLLLLKTVANQVFR